VRFGQRHEQQRQRSRSNSAAKDSM
jgi:hypothetical protein